MKKSLLTLGFVAAFAVGAAAQGTLGIFNPSSAGFNTATSNPLDSNFSDWYTGNLTLSIYTFPVSGNAGTVNTINTEEQTAAGVMAGISYIEAYGTLQDISPSGGGTEAASQKVSVSGGLLSPVSQGDYTIGTSGTLSSTADIYYALVFIPSLPIYSEAAVVLNDFDGYTPDNAAGLWPVNEQNVLLFEMPEPTSLALAGLGGLSLFFLRRRKA